MRKVSLVRLPVFLVAGTAFLIFTSVFLVKINAQSSQCCAGNNCCFEVIDFNASSPPAGNQSNCVIGTDARGYDGTTVWWGSGQQVKGAYTTNDVAARNYKLISDAEKSCQNSTGAAIYSAVGTTASSTEWSDAGNQKYLCTN